MTWEARWAGESSLDNEEERRPFPDRPLGPDSPTVPVDDPLRGRQPYALSAELALAVQALERAEQLVGVDHVEPDAVVAHEDAGLVADGLAADPDLRHRFVTCELPRVADQ